MGEKRGNGEEKKGNSEKQGKGKTEEEELNLQHLQKCVFYARSFSHCISLLAQPKQSNNTE